MHSLTHSLGRIAPILKEVQRVVPQIDWCVAGGAVRDLVLHNEPRDYDVFAYLRTPPTSEIVNDLVRRFRAAGYAQANRKSLSSYAFASIEMWGVKVDIIAVQADSPISVAKAFDFNVCLAASWFANALDCELLSVWTDDDMIASVRERLGDLQLLRDTTPDSTLRRGYNFAHRFGMKFKKEDQLRLAKLFLERNGFEVKP